jgi:hypothetical protein
MKSLKKKALHLQYGGILPLDPSKRPGFIDPDKYNNSPNALPAAPAAAVAAPSKGAFDASNADARDLLLAPARNAAASRANEEEALTARKEKRDPNYVQLYNKGGIVGKTPKGKGVRGMC